MITQPIPTPASRSPRPVAAVLGAGIAGLTAAHELAERGFLVDVYEAKVDERHELPRDPGADYPPVKLGGLAASQYASTQPSGHVGKLRPFPGRPGRPPDPQRPVAGEHGFRFFPAYYLHMRDLLQRIPVYEMGHDPSTGLGWRPTHRTVMDNVRRVVTQATTTPEGTASLIFPREAPRSLAEFKSTAEQIQQLGFTASDVQTFVMRILRYLVTSPLRRRAEMEAISAYEFFIGRDAAVDRRYLYSDAFETQIHDMPKVLAAFDAVWGDARTNMTTFLQLQLQMDRRDNQADGVLNGPTTEAWFDHWYHHLQTLGVQFRPAAVDRVEVVGLDRSLPVHRRRGISVVFADGTRIAPDYVVVALDAPAAERVTAPLRQAGVGGTVAGLEGYTTTLAPPEGPLQSRSQRPRRRREPYAMGEMGREPWDRFQTLAGIQYFFDTEFQLVRGHVYYAGSRWALSSINQHGLWERRPSLVRDGYVSVLSVDIGDFNAPSQYIRDDQGQPLAARDCTPDQIAQEVWLQIASSITNQVERKPDTLLPWPAWYTIDRNLVLSTRPDGSDGPTVRNEAPYLIPIVHDWSNRPGGDPWNPHGSSWTFRPSETAWADDIEHRHVWQARHGGYQVHLNSLVFAGTWARTFTRMTSMEAACESARHAVNAILDHYVWSETGGVDVRDEVSIAWKFPFGFLDQSGSSPVRIPSPAGDYCFVFDIENREPADTRAIRNLDSDLYQAGRPHPWDGAGAPALETLMNQETVVP